MLNFVAEKLLFSLFLAASAANFAAVKNQ